MGNEKTSILLSDVSIEGELVEKDKIIVDAKISGDIKADEIVFNFTIQKISKSNYSGHIL